MNQAVETLFYDYLRVTLNDKCSAALLVLAECLVAGRSTALVPAAPSVVAPAGLLTIAEAAECLELTSRMVYERCLNGHLRPTKIGQTIYVPAAEVERYRHEQATKDDPYGSHV
jgi:excisionase family DNA binding protein